MFQILTSIKDGVLLILNLPLSILSSLDDHLLWCYTELSAFLQASGSTVVTKLSVVLYHVMLTPYYIISYVWDVIAAVFSCIYRCVLT